MLLAAGVLSFLIWAYLLLGRGGFWRIYPVAPPSLPQKSPSERRAPETPVRIAAIVPARNEADVVARAIRSLLQQRGLDSFQIFLIDDGSTDGTAQAASDVAISAGCAARLTIIEGRPLPAGWSGKLWAMQQGIERAHDLNPDFFLFTDADIEHAPDSVSTL